MGAITATTKKTYFENVLSKLPKPVISRWVAVFSFLLFATYCSRSIVFFLPPSTAGNNGTKGFLFFYMLQFRAVCTLFEKLPMKFKRCRRKKKHTPLAYRYEHTIILHGIYLDCLQIVPCNPQKHHPIPADVLPNDSEALFNHQYILYIGPDYW